MESGRPPEAAPRTQTLSKGAPPSQPPLLERELAPAAKEQNPPSHPLRQAFESSVESCSKRVGTVENTVAQQAQGRARCSPPTSSTAAPSSPGAGRGRGGPGKWQKSPHRRPPCSPRGGSGARSTLPERTKRMLLPHRRRPAVIR